MTQVILAQGAASQPTKAEKAAAQTIAEGEPGSVCVEQRDQSGTDAADQHEPAQLSIPSAARAEEKLYASAHIDEPFSEIVQDLYSHNWYVQNPAVIRLSNVGLPSELGASFVLGRAVLQAADGRAWRADRFLGDFDAWSTTPTQSHQAFLAGAAFECCFNCEGAQRTEFKSDYLPLLMTLMSAARWEPARDDFISAVAAFRSRFYWLPDRQPPEISVLVTVNELLPAQVTSILLDVDGQHKRELLSERTNLSDTQIAFDENRLKRAIEQRLMIPSESISVTYLPREPFDHIYYPSSKKLDVDAIF